jgi:hypothetical protein
VYATTSFSLLQQGVPRLVSTSLSTGPKRRTSSGAVAAMLSVSKSFDAVSENTAYAGADLDDDLRLSDYANWFDQSSAPPPDASTPDYVLSLPTDAEVPLNMQAKPHLPLASIVEPIYMYSIPTDSQLPYAFFSNPPTLDSSVYDDHLQSMYVYIDVNLVNTTTDGFKLARQRSMAAKSYLEVLRAPAQLPHNIPMPLAPTSESHAYHEIMNETRSQQNFDDVVAEQRVHRQVEEVYEDAHGGYLDVSQLDN